MADISKELEDIAKAHYGKEVRKSFVDALNIINEVAEKAIDAGTYVDSEESPATYYPDGSHYINTDTNDLWRSKGAGNGWEKVGNLEGQKGDKGDKGDQGLAGAIVAASAKSGACGSGISVENKGTTQNANFEFTIEQPNDIVRIDTEESTLNYGENKITFVMRNGTSKEIVVHNGRLGSGAGSIKDSDVSEQYTWSSEKISDTLVDYSTNRKTDCLNVLGWTVPKGYSDNDNYIDETTREFVQRCDRFNIGILEWEYNSEEEVWEASDEGYNLPHMSADDSLTFTYCDNYKNKTYKALIVNKQFGFTLSLTTEEESKIYVRNGSDTEKPYGYMYYSITPNKRFAVSGNEFASTVNKDYATLSKVENVSSATLYDSADGNIAQIKMYGASHKSANLWSGGNVSGTSSKEVTCNIPSGNLVFSTVATSSDTDASYNTMYLYGASGFLKTLSFSRNTRDSKTYVASENITKILLCASTSTGTSTGDTFSFTDIQIEKGTVATPYEPYGLVMSKGEVTSTNEDESVSSSISAYDTLGNNYLLSVNDVKDELCVNADGTGVLTKKCKIVDLSTYSWTYQSTWGSWFTTNQPTDAIRPSVSGNLPQIISDNYAINTEVNLTNGTNTEIGIGFASSQSSANRTIVRNGSSTDQPSGNMIYILKEPQTINLTASQVQSLLALETYKAHTDIVADCTVDVSYYKDNQNGQSVADVDARYRKLFDSIMDSLS